MIGRLEPSVRAGTEKDGGDDIAAMLAPKSVGAVALSE
jgi:hypothetical protein